MGIEPTTTEYLKMSSTKFEAEKFSGKNDFALWKIKMKALLVQQGLADALKGEKGFLEKMTEQQKDEIMEKAHSAIILCLTDKVLREVAKENTAAGVWTRLEQLYMTKSFTNRLYMKQRLYALRFVEGKSIGEQLDDFNKSIDDLENIDVKLEDEDKAIILLNALPKSFEHLQDAMLFGRESAISLDEVQSALRAKELQKQNGGMQTSNGEGLNVTKFKMNYKKPRTPDSSDNKKPNGKPKETEQKETRKCHYCKKMGHIKKDCYSLKRKLGFKIHKHEDSADCTEELEEAELSFNRNVYGECLDS